MPAPLASDYALPAYAQTQPEDEVSFAMPTRESAGVWRFDADGHFVYLVVSVQATIVSDGTAGDRLFQIAHFDANDNALSNTPAPAVQGPNLTTIYSASAQAGNGYAVGTTAMYMPLPAIPLAPGMRMRIGFFPTDSFPAPFLTVLRYSTAPPPLGPGVAPIPTPVLV